MNLVDEVRKLAQDPNRPREVKLDRLIEAQEEIDIWLDVLEDAEENDEYADEDD